ncbi:hypothetical protein DN748_13165 [Sinomicrobium soli]|nr:hypothetical protein DN748_13165 [Sinomicrobium sp. N-1-3-6]
MTHKYLVRAAFFNTMSAWDRAIVQRKYFFGDLKSLVTLKIRYKNHKMLNFADEITQRSVF